MSTTCRATTKKGAPCPIEAGESGLCHVHDPALQCGAPPMGTGKTCRTATGGVRCVRHAGTRREPECAECGGGKRMKVRNWPVGARRLFRGRVRQGGRESGSGRFIIAVRGRGKSDNCLLVLTDRRMLILERPCSPEREEATLRGEFPRGSYGLRSEPPPARHKDRVDIAFADGSWVAVNITERSEIPELKRYLAG